MAAFNVGFIGAGRASELHARGYQDHADADIVAVCDRDEGRAIERSLDWNADAYYTDASRMLAEADLDAVIILTPNGLHAEQAIEALEAGIHVCVERPVALTIEDANRVARAADSNPGILQVYEPCLFHKPLLDGRNLIDGGEIGEPNHIRIAANVANSTEGSWNLEALAADHWRFEPEMGGHSPLLFDVNYQAFCLALFLIGSVERIEVWQSETQLNNGHTLGAPSTAIWKHFQQTCFGTFSLNYTPDRTFDTSHPPIEFEVEISGSQGNLTVRRTPSPERHDTSVRLQRDGRTVTYSQKADAYERSFKRATQNFIEAAQGAGDPLLRASEAKQLLVLTLAFNESARHAQSVTLQHG